MLEEFQFFDSETIYKISLKNSAEKAV